MRSRRSLKLAASVAVAAISLGAAIGVVQALVAWTAQAEVTELRELYGVAEGTLATERTVLAGFRRLDQGGGTTRLEYAAAAAAADEALDDVAEQVQAGERTALTQLMATHRSARRSALRALADPAADARGRTEYRRAVRLLEGVAGSLEMLATRHRSSTLASWPRTPVAYIGLLAVAIAALAGIVAMGRLAIELVTRPKQLDRRDQNHELARLVSVTRTDSLTKLANHRAFHDDLAAEIDRRNSTGSLFSLMAIDLDGLKTVNDTQGHQAGDAYIVRLAQAMESVVGSAGSVYRTGGDEFMVILPGSRNWHTINIARRLLGASKTRSGARALSIGVTETKGTEHRQVLLRQADLALYEAKRSTIGIVPFEAGMEPAGSAPSSDDLSRDQRALAVALSRTVDARDPGTRDHSERVAELAIGIAARQGIKGLHLEQLRVAALLHDVGKIGVSDSILHKRTPLAAGERDEMRHHIVVGRDILVAAGFVEAATWVYHHHEHMDGTGYPDGLRETAIPLESRIIAVADAFEVMTGSRPYRENVSTEQALAELFECAGSQFDIICVRALAELVSGDLPPGLLSPGGRMIPT